MQRGHPQEEANQDPSEEAAIKHISFYEGYTPKYPTQEKECNSNELQLSIGTGTYCIKLMGLATYAAHKWQDKAQSTQTVTIPTNVSVKLNY